MRRTRYDSPVVPPSRTAARFIVLDGVDGCGKTTQARRLVIALEKETNAAPLHLREPGSTRLGENLRSLLLAREHAPSPAVETLLFAAARRQMLDEIVRPALDSGRTVVCERFHASTFAYQAVAGGLDESRVLALLAEFAGDPRPDLVIVLDLPVELAAERRGAGRDRIEDRGVAFQRRVAEGFRRFAERAGTSLAKKTVVIDAHGSEDLVFERVWTEVRRAL